MERVLSHKLIFKAIGSGIVDGKYSGWTQRWANSVLHQMLGELTLPI